MKQKLIFLDIDGTLTPPGQNTPPKSAMEAIRKAQALGHKVFLCTGRNRGMLAPVLAPSHQDVWIRGSCVVMGFPRRCARGSQQVPRKLG